MVSPSPHCMAFLATAQRGRSRWHEIHFVLTETPENPRVVTKKRPSLGLAFCWFFRKKLVSLRSLNGRSLRNAVLITFMGSIFVKNTIPQLVYKSLQPLIILLGMLKFVQIPQSVFPLLRQRCFGENNLR